MPRRQDLRDLTKWVLLEMPSGFGLFVVNNWAIEPREKIWASFTEGVTAEHIATLAKFIKVDDKSVAWRSDIGPGKDLTKLIMQHCKEGDELIVQDADLKHVIHSKLGVDCFYEPYVSSELMWGLRNVLHHFLSPRERTNITPQYLLPLCQGIKDFICDFKIDLSTEAIDVPFIASAGGLYRCEFMFNRLRKKFREEYDKVFHEIGKLIEDDKLYAEAVVKILTPQMEPEWNFSERFPDKVAHMLKKLDDDSGHLRKKIDAKLYIYLYRCLGDFKRFPTLRAVALERVKSAADRCRGRQRLQIAEKRSHSEVVEGTSSQDESSKTVEGTSSQDERSTVDANGEGRKKARTIVASCDDMVEAIEGTCGLDEQSKAAEGNQDDHSRVDANGEGQLLRSCDEMLCT